MRVSVDVTDDHVEIGVQDEGRGMGSEPGALLEAFDRAGELLTRDRRGLGIGLTLVRELAPLLDAPLTVASADGSGTVVTLLLPRRSAAAETAEHSPGDGGASLPDVIHGLDRAPQSQE